VRLLRKQEVRGMSILVAIKPRGQSKYLDISDICRVLLLSLDERLETHGTVCKTGILRVM
jgi:hypothetical protein